MYRNFDPERFCCIFLWDVNLYAYITEMGQIVVAHVLVLRSSVIPYIVLVLF